MIWNQRLLRRIDGAEQLSALLAKEGSEAASRKDVGWMMPEERS
jgi:hypothetical protein